jgi:hypothetical protein
VLSEGLGLAQKEVSSQKVLSQEELSSPKKVLSQKEVLSQWVLQEHPLEASPQLPAL